MISELNISTKARYQLIDITDEVERTVRESDVQDGAVLVFSLHTTAGVLLNENEEGLKKDWLKVAEKLVSGFDFEHNKIDNNADAHILASLIGQEKVLPIKNGKIARGVWQQIFLLELDGPRDRRIVVKIIR